MKKTWLLPDVNVWVALTFDSHPHHPSAKTWYDGLTDEPLFFCRMTQPGFLRLASNPKVAGTHVLTLTEAWQKYDTYLSSMTFWQRCSTAPAVHRGPIKHGKKAL